MSALLEFLAYLLGIVCSATAVSVLLCGVAQWWNQPLRKTKSRIGDRPRRREDSLRSFR